MSDEQTENFMQWADENLAGEKPVVVGPVFRTGHDLPPFA